MSDAALSVRGVSKSFGATQVLKNVSLEVTGGQVHGLFGGNGSGKSTLIKVLAGVHAADSGSVSHAGHTIRAEMLSPKASVRLGLRFVHQDLAVVAAMSVAENLALVRGYPRTRLGGIDWRRVNSQCAEVLERFGLSVAPTSPLGDLTPPQRTMVAVIRALHGAGVNSVLVLDEPTATMPPDQSRELLGLIRQLAAEGRSVIFVSHRLGEVLEFTDALTCLRDGRVVASRPTEGLTHDDLVDLITGTSVATADQRPRPVHPAATGVVTRLRIPASDGRELELPVRAGEVVGLAGLVGSGRTRTLGRLYGLGADAHTPGSPHAAVRQGIAYVPEHRALDGIFGDRSITTNVVAAHEGKYWRGWMRNRAQRRDAAGYARRCQVQTAHMSLPISALSGGNQQKTVLARWLLTKPRLLLLDEPTQGVDVAGRTQIHELLRQQVDGGMAVVLTSSDFEEMAALCDRVVVLVRGRWAAELAGPEVTAERMGQLANSRFDESRAS